MKKFSNNHNRFEKMLEEFKTPFHNDPSVSWESVQNKINSLEANVIPIQDNLKKKSYWLAASIVGLIALSSLVLINQSKNRHSTFATEKTIDLSDGSSVHLFKNSSFSFYETKEERRLSLNGGGIFSIKKGVPLAVKTKQGIVKVLGTVFSVESREKHFSVKCSEGRVEVQSEKEKVILKAGEAIRYSNDLFFQYTFNTEELNARKNGVFYFEKAPLSEVFLQLENEFQVEINFPSNLKDKLYSGNFNNNDFSEALKLVAVPMNLQYEIIGKEVVITE